MVFKKPSAQRSLHNSTGIGVRPKPTRKASAGAPGCSETNTEPGWVKKRRFSMKKTDLSSFNNSSFRRGASMVRELLWLVCSSLFLRHSLSLSNGLKIRLLRMFGARIGQGVLIKPAVTIKFPWKLSVGDHVWIGEQVWIDNLDDVSIGNHVCISQGALLLCGNHNYKSTSFDLITGPIVLEEGSWIGAKSVVCPGVRVGSHAVLAVGSVATQHLTAYTIYAGNPAMAVRERIIN